MVKCGIKKYDELPPKISGAYDLVDVDYLRWMLNRMNSGAVGVNATQLTKRKIIRKLDEAVLRYDLSKELEVKK